MDCFCNKVSFAKEIHLSEFKFCFVNTFLVIRTSSAELFFLNSHVVLLNTSVTHRSCTGEEKDIFAYNKRVESFNFVVVYLHHTFNNLSHHI